MFDRSLPTVVIIGAGFGGLKAARALAGKPVNVLLIDRNNFHTFTPLLYQVATSGLDPSDIAYPVRSIFRNAKDKNVRFLLGEVTEINHDDKQLVVRENGVTHVEDYDYLIVAAGTVTNHFNNASVERYSFGLKDLQDSVKLRNHILKLFEKAVWVQDAEEREALMTLVVVGGGPTGLETAGALYELYNHVLTKEYPHSEPSAARVVLIEAMDKLLAPYPPRLQQSAHEQLESLGVEVIMGQAVQEVAPDHIVLNTGEVIRTYTLVWAAGVKTSPIAQKIGVELQRGGRVPVEPTMEVIGREDMYVIGDLSYLPDAEGKPYPQVIPVAQQQGALAAENIYSKILGQPAEKTFKYRDRGVMATIGRKRAVAWPFYKLQLTGYFAWASWLVLHLVWLLGFRNRMSVLVKWIWSYFTYDRSVRIIMEEMRTDEIQLHHSDGITQGNVPAAEADTKTEDDKKQSDAA